MIKKDSLEIEIVNESKLRKLLLKDDKESKTDTLTVIKTESGEEFIVFDLQEENSNSKVEDKESIEELGLKTNLEEEE
jgi:hypothetical protein